jgi:aspartyl-tRNA(Asn)/glutamyl-tRNA(Gln) amidotransferase subunit C
MELMPLLCYTNAVRLTREEVQRVAMLARLRLSPDEEQHLTAQLEKILQYVEKLNELDTSQVEPFTHAVELTNAFREDRATNRPHPAELLANAPEKEENFFKVPKIIE